VIQTDAGANSVRHSYAGHERRGGIVRKPATAAGAVEFYFEERWSRHEVTDAAGNRTEGGGKLGVDPK
jgi:hypothetical protein